MTISRRGAILVVLLTSMVATAFATYVLVPRWLAPKAAASIVAPAPPPADPGPRIKARLFYVADDGSHLVGVERDVPYASQTAEQARAILTAQLASAQAPLISAIPSGTRLRAIYVTRDGDAYVDLSQDVATAHPGGSTNELLTVYTIVHALTSNLPAVLAVQILVDGKETDTLAGHVDLRRPLTRRPQLVAPGT